MPGDEFSGGVDVLPVLYGVQRRYPVSELAQACVFQSSVCVFYTAFLYPAADPDGV